MPRENASFSNTQDINVDPFVGAVIFGKTVLPLTGDEGEDTLLSHLDSGARVDPGRDGVVTYSFYNGQHSNGWLAAGHLPGYLRDAEGNFIPLEGGNGMTPFTAEQEAAARDAIQMWDDLIPVEFREVNGHGSGTADIVFANSADPAQAFAYGGGSIRGAWDGFLGDVFIADPDLNSSNLDLNFGQYGRTTLIHEIGHSLGLSHPGNYNFSVDEEGNPIPITYAADAEYFQDSQQYTIMSYFGGWETGAAPIDWLYSGGALFDGSPQGPMLHDIVAIQAAYGADPTTRAGETTYGFNSNAGNALFDFNQNPLPYYALYDAGGVDTIDLSGFESSQYINLTPGTFSSIGEVTKTAEELGEAFHETYLLFGIDLFEAPYGFDAESLGNFSLSTTKAANAAALEADTGVAGLGTVNYETFAIAYGTIIENAVGGQGRDLIVGNDADNELDGQGGDDVIQGGVGDDLLTGGDGADTFLYESGDDGQDTIGDFETGVDQIDLSALGVDASAVHYDATSHLLTVDGTDMSIVVLGSDFNMGTDLVL